MNYTLEGVETQQNQMKANMEQNDREILDYQKQLEERERQLKIGEMKQAQKKLERIAGAYKGSRKPREYVREDENGDIVVLSDVDESEYDEDDHGDFDVTELITDNAVLLNRVDELLAGEDGTMSTRRSMDSSADVESLTSSLIDGLFNQVKNNERKQKSNGGPTQKKGTNYVSGKKQVVTLEK